MSEKGRPVAFGVAVVLLMVVVIVVLGRVGGSAEPASITLKHRQGPYAMALTLRPAKTGQNTFTVALRRGSRPITPANVRVLVTMLDMPMPQQVVVLKKNGPGEFVGTENLGMGGHWQFELIVSHLPGTSTLTTATFRATVT
jgi:hypothetical protein